MRLYARPTTVSIAECGAHAAVHHVVYVLCFARTNHLLLPWSHNFCSPACFQTLLGMRSVVFSAFYALVFAIFFTAGVRLCVYVSLGLCEVEITCVKFASAMIIMVAIAAIQAITII